MNKEKMNNSIKIYFFNLSFLEIIIIKIINKIRIFPLQNKKKD